MSTLVDSIAAFRALDEGMTPEQRAVRAAAGARKAGEGRLHHLARRADWAIGDAAKAIKKKVSNVAGSVKSKLARVGRSFASGNHAPAPGSGPHRVVARPKPAAPQETPQAPHPTPTQTQPQVRVTRVSPPPAKRARRRQGEAPHAIPVKAPRAYPVQRLGSSPTRRPTSVGHAAKKLSALRGATEEFRALADPLDEDFASTRAKVRSGELGRRPKPGVRPDTRTRGQLAHDLFVRTRPAAGSLPKAVWRVARGNPKTEDTTMSSKLREAIEGFRGLSEAKAKVGDYVTTIGGERGYVQAVEGDRLAIERISGQTGRTGTIVYVPAANVNVNPGGPVI